jgi:hypothetical protein
MFMTLIMVLTTVSLLFAQNMRKKELVSQRTKNSKTFINADTTWTKEISLAPVHYLKGFVNRMCGLTWE